MHQPDQLVAFAIQPVLASTAEQQLELPETGVCSSDAGTSCDVPAAVAVASESSCCAAPEPVLVGFPTGLSHGRSGEDQPAVSLLHEPSPEKEGSNA